MHAGDGPDIRDAAHVDAAWITDVLHRSGIGTGRRVVAIDGRSIGTGQVGENVRYTLVWNDGAGPVPSTVVVKFPALDAESRATAVQLDTYRKEVGFYRDVATHVTVRSPMVHHLGWDPQTHDFVLVMEDLRGSEAGDQLQGCSVARAEAAVDEVVGLHAPTWGRVDELGAGDWLAPPTSERVAGIVGLAGLMWPGFDDRYRDRLTGDDLELGHQVVLRTASILAAAGAWADELDAWCVVHGDYRLDNLLFGVTDHAPPVTVVDWQTTGVGAGPSDVAYFLGAGLLPDDRRHHERRLVDRYAAGLRRAGVDVGDDDVWRGYVLGTAGGYLMAVIASQLVGRTERGDEMFATMAERHAAQIRDTGLLDLV